MVEQDYLLSVERIQLDRDDAIRDGSERYTGEELRYRIGIINNDSNRVLLRAEQYGNSRMRGNRQQMSRNYRQSG